MDKLKEGRVLLIGEGDFSFSVAFSKHIADKVTVTSTCLLTPEELKNLHKNGPDNVKLLTEQGVKVMYSVDARHLEDIEEFQDKFDRIIFNFPHVGGKSNIKKNRELLKDFFASVFNILAGDGDICVSFCRGQGGTPADEPIRAWHDSWQSVGAAAYYGIVLREIWPFNTATYPEYSSTGFRSMDRNFFTEGAMTYVFKRCIPLTETVNLNGLEDGVLCIQGKNYQMSSEYVAKKFNRNLLTIENHPIHLTSRHILQALAKSWSTPLEELSAPSPVFMEEIEHPRTLAYSISTSRPNSNTESSESSEISHDLDNSENGSESVITTLRRSLLDHLSDHDFMCDLKQDTLYSVSGNVCRQRPHINSNDLPVQHELMLILKTKNVEGDSDKLKETVSEAMCDIVTSENTFLMTQEFDDHQEWFNETFAKRHCLYSLEVAYKSVRLPETNACNQVRETGPAEITKPAKSIKMSWHFGFLGISTSSHDESEQCVVALLNLDALAMVKYDIPDSRLLWSKDSAFLEQFSKLTPVESHRFKPLSLYPVLWRHDLSFWEGRTEPFSEQKLFDIIRGITGDTLKQLLLMNRWDEPGTGRVSRCYRLVYQSYEYAVSHAKAHELQDAVRSTVVETMGAVLR